MLNKSCDVLNFLFSQPLKPICGSLWRLPPRMNHLGVRVVVAVN